MNIDFITRSTRKACSFACSFCETDTNSIGYVRVLDLRYNERRTFSVDRNHLLGVLDNPVYDFIWFKTRYYVG